MSNSFVEKDDAVSVVTGYILVLAVASILFTVTILANQAYISQAAGTTLNNGFSTLGSDLTLRLSNLDRLINSTSSMAGNLTNFSLSLSIPTTIGGETYTLDLTSEFVLLTPTRLTEYAVRIPINLAQPVTNATLSSSTGTLVVRYNDTTNSMEFTS